jgi:hypothetical protein
VIICDIIVHLLVIVKSKRIPSIFKDESTGIYICLWKFAVAVATYVSLLTTMPNISQLDNNANCISMATLTTLCIVDRLRLHQKQEINFIVSLTPTTPV